MPREIVSGWNVSSRLKLLGNRWISSRKTLVKCSKHRRLTRRVTTEKSRFHSESRGWSGEVREPRRIFRLRWNWSSVEGFVERRSILPDMISLGKTQRRKTPSFDLGTLTMYRPGSQWRKHDERKSVEYGNREHLFNETRLVLGSKISTDEMICPTSDERLYPKIPDLTNSAGIESDRLRNVLEPWSDSQSFQERSHRNEDDRRVSAVRRSRRLCVHVHHRIDGNTSLHWYHQHWCSVVESTWMFD